MRVNNEILHFQTQIKESLNYFEEFFYTSIFEHLNDKGIPIRKNIFFDALKNLSQDEDGELHNCLPCNLSDGAILIRQFLENNLNCESIKYFVNIYTFLLYQQSERLGVVYFRLGFKTNKNEFNWQEFPNLQFIKYWANFFKHPKSSMFIHHPTYHIESYKKNPNFRIDGIINSEFIKRYYSGPNLNNELEVLLLNKDYKIFFPDLIEFTKKICLESEKLISIINSNTEFIEKLKIFRKENI